MSGMEDDESSPENKFSQLPRSSIRNIAESTVDDNLSDDILGLLAEDVNYRLRALVASAMQYMKHSHRRTLTVDDMNRALQSCHAPVIFGHSNPEVPSYLHIDDKNNPMGISTLFCFQEKAVDLEKVATTTKKFDSLPSPQVNLTWGAIEGAACPPCYFAPLSETALSPSKRPVPATTVIPEELIDYYNAVTDAILGNDESALKLALSDLQKNTRISPLLPNLVNFVSVGVEKLSHDICQLTKLLQTIQSVVINPNLFIGHESYLTLLVQCVFNCVVKQLPVSINTKLDHWMLRNSAAELLAKIHRDWASPVNKLYRITLTKFEDIFKDVKQPFCCHYGAVVGIKAFGIVALETFLYPHMSSYMTHLNKILNDCSYENIQIRTDAQKVYNILLNVSVEIIQSYIQEIFNLSPSKTKVPNAFPFDDQLKSSNITDTCSHKDNENVSDDVSAKAPHAFEMYRIFYDHFGDAFKNSLPWIPAESVYIPPKSKPMHLYSHAETNRADNDLLELFRENDHSKSKKRHLDDDQDSFHGDDDDKHNYGKYEDFHVKKLVTEPGCGIKLTIADTLKEMKKISTSDQRDDFHSSDRSAHNLGSCDDLQVSGLVSDPASGVKLVITKRNKKGQKPKMVSEPIEPKKPKIVIKETLPPKPIFDYAPNIQEKRKQMIEFDFSGADPLPLKALKQKKCGTTSSESNLTHSVYSKLQKHLKLTGKRQFDAKKWYHRKISTVPLTNIL